MYTLGDGTLSASRTVYDKHKGVRVYIRGARRAVAVPHTGGGEYAGDATTLSNREEWLSSVDPDGRYTAMQYAEFSFRQLWVRGAIAKLDSKRLRRFEYIFKPENFLTLCRITEALRRLANYPLLNEELHTEVTERHFRKHWPHYKHDCAVALAVARGESEPSELDFDEWLTVSHGMVLHGEHAGDPGQVDVELID